MENKIKKSTAKKGTNETTKTKKKRKKGFTLIELLVVIAIIAYGIVTLAFQNCQKVLWLKNRDKISLILNAIAVLLFIISSQVYAGAFLFIFLAIKTLMLIKW